MTLDDIKTIGIVGAGQMGCAISQVGATAGYQVRLVDVAEPPLMDMDRLFADIPPDPVTTSMTSNGPAAMILAPTRSQHQWVEARAGRRQSSRVKRAG